MLANTKQWIAWLAATVVAAVSMSAFVFSNFQTIERAKEDKADIKQEIQEVKADIKELLRRTQ